jgi:hypothetical protein
MRSYYILILSFLISISSDAQTHDKDELEPYYYDTILKGGYLISFKVDDSEQYLYLMKAGRRISKLASTTRGMPYKNLGYAGADFREYFVLVHSFGSGNPHEIELIKKSTGKNILNSGATWIDVDVRKELLLYSEKDIMSKQDKMKLYNMQTRDIKLFSFPEDMTDDPGEVDTIKISEVTDSQLVIIYKTKRGAKLKLYRL